MILSSNFELGSMVTITCLVLSNVVECNFSPIRFIIIRIEQQLSLFHQPYDKVYVGHF